MQTRSSEVSFVSWVLWSFISVRVWYATFEIALMLLPRANIRFLSNRTLFTIACCNGQTNILRGWFFVTYTRRDFDKAMLEMSDILLSFRRNPSESTARIVEPWKKWVLSDLLDIPPHTPNDFAVDDVRFRDCVMKFTFIDV